MRAAVVAMIKIMEIMRAFTMDSFDESIKWGK